MSIEEKIEISIRKQLLTNRRKNLLYSGLDETNHFVSDTKDLLLNHKAELLEIDREQRSGKWIEMMTQLAFNTFCNSNQFLDLRAEDYSGLRTIYKSLWDDIILALASDDIDFNALQHTHLNRLTLWLTASNIFIKTINKPDVEEIVDVVCAEYSAVLQIQLLGIDLSELKEPILDIGCGENASLVSYLTALGFDAYGIDRLTGLPGNRLISVNWIDFNFKPGYWGSVIANNSFTLHFIHHNARQDSEYVVYAKKYMEILNSLLPGGTFYYAPSVPFIETFLAHEDYLVERKSVGDKFQSTRIQKLR